MAIAARGEWWRLHRNDVGGQVLRGITNAATRWVLVGEVSGSPLIVTTETTDEQTNLPTFTSRTPGGTDPLNDVTYISSPPLVAACGDNGVIESSSDQGQNWTDITLSGTPDLYGITGFSGDATSRFITVGVNEIWGQNSGVTWSRRWSGSQTYRSVAHREVQGFVAVGDNGFAAHSPTGASGTWTAPYSMGIGHFLKIATNNSYFMAISDSGYLYRSTTGLSASWTLVRNFGTTMASIVPILTIGSWVAFSQGFDAWITTDDGDTWTQITPDLVREVTDAHSQGTRAMTCGPDGVALITYNDSQEDFVSTAVEPAPPPAFSPNDDMAGDAVRRLVTQFRSSS